MARPALTNEELVQFRAALCDAALELYATGGQRAVTMRAVAEVAGCSRTLPYRYFADKQAMLVAMRARCFARFTAYQRAVYREHADPRARLDALGQGYLAFAREQPHAFAVMFDLYELELHEHEELTVQIRASWTVLVDAVRDAVNAGVLCGEPRALGRLFWAGVHGVVTLAHGPRHSWHGVERDVADMVNALVFAHQHEQKRCEPAKDVETQ